MAHSSRKMGTTSPVKRVISAVWVVLLLLLACYSGFRAGDALATALSEGTFVLWRQLEAPPEDVASILTSNTYIVQIETRSGEVYQAEISKCLQSAGGCWEKANRTYELEPPYWHKGSRCRSCFQEMKEPPGRIVECGSATLPFECYREAHYALLEDGTIWVWQHAVCGLGPGGVLNVGNMLICGTTSLGLLLGLGISVVFPKVCRA